MNVLYDIATLGLMSETSTPLTGIPRVIEELACSLDEVQECSLELCSNGFRVSSFEYAKANPRLKNLRYAHSSFSVSLQKKQEETQRAFNTSSGIAHLGVRAQRKLLHSLTSVTGGSLEAQETHSLRRADIFHTSFSVVPEQAKGIQRPQVFLTIYDLIPILFPQYCKVEVSEGFGAILSSITQDTWMVSISEATKTDYCNHLPIDPSHVFVTPLAADARLFHPVTDLEAQAGVRHKYKIPAGPYVLSLCTIEPRKNIDHVIRCFVKLVQEQHLHDLILVLAGAKGWSYEHIFKEIDGAEAVKNQIVVTGFVANEDLAALYSGALAFVFPSLYEGFGLPPLEAMQCGTPVITSNTSSLPEVVGEAGIMLDPHDVDGLCGALLSLYQDTDLRAALSAKSLLRAKEFSWKRCAEDTVHAYKTALGQR